MFTRLQNIGPGALVAAAFIGPGTVTACTLAGAGYGYALLWALVFATLATIVLQEMAARLGTSAGLGLGEALRLRLMGSPLRYPLFALVLVALYLGNAAYEGGNLSGSYLGAQALFGDISKAVFLVPMIGFSGALLWFGGYKVLEKILICLVLIMAVAFIIAFFVIGVDFTGMLKGMFSPNIPKGSLLTVLALVGTTVVPYNLFLHASACKEKWAGITDENALKNARADTFISIGFGGLVSILIAATAAAAMFGQGLQINSAADMAKQLRPIAGDFAPALLGIGLLAAGFTSAITAPLATGYAVSEILGWGTTDKRGRLVALSVLIIGGAIALTGFKSISIILTAQFANGLLLPIIVGFLLFAMNQKSILGAYVNGKLANICGGLVMLVSLGLGARMIARTFGLI
ncbi:MAG: manganese transporter [Robiginitomaculum sp.]|nr:MAG: manganese transporter [Robiginitomaculum sp.]